MTKADEDAEIKQGKRKKEDREGERKKGKGKEQGTEGGREGGKKERRWERGKKKGEQARLQNQQGGQPVWLEHSLSWRECSESLKDFQLQLAEHQPKRSNQSILKEINPEYSVKD